MYKGERYLIHNRAL